MLDFPLLWPQCNLVKASALVWLRLLGKLELSFIWPKNTTVLCSIVFLKPCSSRSWLVYIDVDTPISHVTFGELQTAPCTAPCTLTLPRLSCIAPSHCGTPRRSVLRIQPPTLQIPVRHHLQTLRWCECEGCGLVASISTIITTTPPCAVIPPVTCLGTEPGVPTPRPGTE